MNFQQLRIVRETARQNFNLTEVANALFTSQSGVSKHIKDLEEELGVELYVRKGKRLLGLTEPGQQMLVYVERMLMDARNIKNLAEHYQEQDSGELTIATTHTQARYALPEVVSQFKQQFPKVRLRLHQGSPDEIVSMLLSGEADIGVATEALGDIPQLVSFPYHRWHHGVVVPKLHPLTEIERLTLEDIQHYPIITYHEGFTGRASIEKAFATENLRPEIIMTALDADVIKSYVELRLGIGIIASVAFNPARDSGLQLLNTDHLFEEKQTRIGIRRGNLLRNYAFQFIQLCAPELTEDVVAGQLALPSGR
ncbi:hypothetical protein Q672_07140 [Marinobacter sp. EVN1]|uniref:CysB family HTH-type transcriptional regulator n=1 Tax=Marinobacter sp. EVN1 TaxID=1397532 RepID=UPI0003B8AEDE|nr:CysB family HTH-type transcriptional regulator [Marinobacter sp. EVN1]ERS81083.1 hypothetical protein Q672_07140 [Marinobacter sp. EVN1]